MAQTQQKRVFMTGASGYVGSVVTELAIAQGYRVHGLSRSENSDGTILRNGAVPVRGDLTSVDVIRRESAGADMVIHLASAYTVGTASYDNVMPIDIAAVDAMAEGLEGSGKPLVTTSGTLLVAPDPNGGETDETSPEHPDPINTRGKHEDYALGLAKRGIRVTSIRLAPYVYGRGGSGVALFMRMGFNAGAITMVDGGKNHTTFVHVDDAARLYLLAAEEGKSGEVYNASGGNDVTARQLYEAIAAAAQVPANDVSLDEAKETLGLTLARFLSAPNRASNAKAKRALGWQPKEASILEDINKGSYQAVAASLRDR